MLCIQRSLYCVLMSVRDIQINNTPPYCQNILCTYYNRYTLGIHIIQFYKNIITDTVVAYRYVLYVHNRHWNRNYIYFCHLFKVGICVPRCVPIYGMPTYVQYLITIIIIFFSFDKYISSPALSCIYGSSGRFILHTSCVIIPICLIVLETY